MGTGRIALPLAERGLDVWGIDGSAEMLELLRDRPGGDKVSTVCGDFATVTADGEFDLVVLLVNTIYAMHTQEDQITASPTQLATWLPADASWSKPGFLILRGVMASV